MNKLGTHPVVVGLARGLGLPARGDCLGEIEAYALRRTADIIERSLMPITSLEGLKGVLADALSINMQYLHSDADLDRVAQEFESSFPKLRRRLELEFNRRGTEGLLLENFGREEWELRYLAIIDCRGSEANRANFTSWHELIHVLVAPDAVPQEGVRRDRSPAVSVKEPLEQVVDAVTGRLAFYDELFLPIFTRECSGQPLDFDLVERVRLAAAPGASFQSTAMACARVCRDPVLFVKVEYGLKASERRVLSSGQGHLNLGATLTALALRISQCFANEASKRTRLKIFKQMRVPRRSVLAAAHDATDETEYTAVEDQAWWETSRAGRLAPLPLRVRAIRRGGHVYGLISPLAS